MARDEDPILWAENAIRESKRRVNGRIIVERFPQTDPELAKNGVRTWAKLVDGAGNVVSAPLTNGAADLDIGGNNAQRMRAKWRREGWFPYGKCPIALVMSLEMSRSSLDESLHGQTPCQPGTYSERDPCPHTVAEVGLRQRMQAQIMAERLPKLNDLADQLVDVQKEQAQQNKQLVADMASVVREAVQAVASAAMQPAPAAVPAAEEAPRKDKR
jgi:hypothetical protein